MMAADPTIPFGNRTDPSLTMHMNRSTVCSQDIGPSGIGDEQILSTEGLCTSD